MKTEYGGIAFPPRDICLMPSTNSVAKVIGHLSIKCTINNVSSCL